MQVPDYSTSDIRLELATYDRMSRRTSITHPDSSIATIQYDSFIKSTFTDESGKVTTLERDPTGAVFKDTNYVTTQGNRLVTSQYKYLPLGLLLSVTDPIGAVSTWNYSARGMPISISDPNSRNSDQHLHGMG